MPHRNTRLPLHFDTVEPLDNREHPFDHSLRREIGPQLFFIEVI